MANLDKKESHNEEINELNVIITELLSDAGKLAGDLISGIYMYFFMGIMSILFGILTAWSNRYYILNGDYVGTLLAGMVAVSGFFIIIKGVQLREKYSKIFKLHKKFKQNS
ncbi:MAG: hypothetical protein AC479_02945 [miscellaneous Crenarchaeota group-6 archaeon AD8-1]|nr:MAG: hypothetical protein AC479_02945 [miscellaneous Crenarchaeota group-6 archaeon AD8-1]